MSGVTRGRCNSHVGPMVCTWAAPPTRMSSGLRAHQGVCTHNQGLTCEQHTTTDTVAPKMQTTSQLAARIQRFSPRWSAFWALSPSTRPLGGGNYAMQGCDTPATRRQSASHGAKPPPATGLEGTGGSGGPEGLAAVPGVSWPGRSTRKRQQHPAQANFARNSPTTWIDAHSKTAEYQRSDFNT